MKIRKGFVSNSSSSSFICGVCGTVESGYDASLSDFEMSQCEQGHYFCNHHGLGASQIKEILNSPEKTVELFGIREHEYLSDEEKAKIENEIELLFKRNSPFDLDDINSILEDNGIDSYELETPKGLCPVCTLAGFTDDVLVKFLLIEMGKKKEDSIKDLQRQFKSLRQLEENYKEHNNESS